MSRNFDIFSLTGQVVELQGATFIDYPAIAGQCAFQIKMLAGGTMTIGDTGSSFAYNGYVMSVNEIQSFNLSGSIRVLASSATITYTLMRGKTAGT